MRTPLPTLDSRRFDIVIVGGGISGASCAQHLAGAGYAVLLVEKGDFASAATSRSSRLLHCGLRYMAPARTPWEFLAAPRRLFMLLGQAKRSVEVRRDFARTIPGRLNRLPIHWPVYRDAPYRSWHIDLGARLLAALNRGGPDLEYARLSPAEALSRPLTRWLRDPQDLRAVIRFLDFQFHWPERICMDAVLDARRLGAVARNYTAATSFSHRPGEGWTVGLEDRLEGGGGGRATVHGRLLLNLAGVWIDGLNREAAAGAPTPRKIVAVKGAHIAVQLPPDCRGIGMAGLNTEGEHMFCLPWGDLHYIGPTETIYEGDIEDVHPTEEDVEILLHEVNFMLPGIGLARKDVQFCWAGARPITFDPGRAKGRRLPFSVLHEMDDDGVPDALALTWAAIMFHREAAKEMAGRVARRLRPSGAPGAVSYEAWPDPPAGDAPPLLNERPDVTLDGLRHLARTEQPGHLPDLLFRRTGLGWRASIPPDAARRAAEAVAEDLGWDAARVDAEVAAYERYVARFHTPG